MVIQESHSEGLVVPVIADDNKVIYVVITLYLRTSSFDNNWLGRAKRIKTSLSVCGD